MLCKLSNLNIGVAQSVQSSLSFFVALGDYFFFGKSLTRSMFTGMLLILACVVCISLSSLGRTPALTTTHEATVPIYAPLLVSMTVPIVMGSNILIAKFATTVYHVPSRDFTFGFYLVMSAAAFIASMTYFATTGSFQLHYFLLGLVGSTAQITGILFVNLATSTGKHAGPAVAII